MLQRRYLVKRKVFQINRKFHLLKKLINTKFVFICHILSMGQGMHRLCSLLRERHSNTPKKKSGVCPWYNTKHHLVVRLQFWKCGVHLHCWGDQVFLVTSACGLICAWPPPTMKWVYVKSDFVRGRINTRPWLLFLPGSFGSRVMLSFRVPNFLLENYQY